MTDTDTETLAAARPPLTRDRVLQAAVELADRDGIDAVSMRKLGQELGVEAMALYRHVRDKDDILDGVVDRVVAEIELPEPDPDWRAAMRGLSLAARDVMLRHPWAPPVIVEQPTVGPATLRHIDAVMAILNRGGFPIELAHHALHVLGSRILGFTQDPFNDAADPRPDPQTALVQARALAAAYPNLGELALAATHDGALGGCDDDFEFAFGLDLILDGLERRRAAA
ncbi:MAG TPA: TetR/AcrR family transcriptional regulator [Candidatus Limnocylindrales bacterium]|jgi:AcrR family transcriptional regulator